MSSKKYTNSVNLLIFLLTNTILYVYCLSMEIEFAEPEMEKLAKDAKYIGKHSFAKIKKYRERINRIMQAMNRRDLYAQKSLRLEKLKGERKHQHSIRLNDQNRLIVEFVRKGQTEIAKIIAMEDYHK